MNKYAILLLALLSALVSLSPQEFPDSIDDVITWNFSVECVGDDEVVLWMKVTQRDGWHIYAQVQPDGAIPMPTEFTFAPNSNYSLVGKTKEYGAKVFDADGYPEKSFHGDQAKFSQKIKVKSRKDFKITLDYGFMACKTACLPPEFRTQEIKIPGLDNMDCSGDVETNERRNNRREKS